MFHRIVCGCLLAVLSVMGGCAGLGPFTAHQDVGTPSKVGPGTTTYDAGKKMLTVTGGGANVWAASDNMQFVWVKMSGDVQLAADVAFAKETPGVIAHRKAVLMIRQTLDADSPYADACVHGNGMTALQWRDAKGATSFEIQANADGPRRLRIEKRGDYFSMSIGNSDTDLKNAGGACRVALTGDFYVGIGVCSHSVDRVETATFSNIAMSPLVQGTRSQMVSTLEIYALSSKDRKVVYTATKNGNTRFEAPNWSRDNSNTLFFNDGGHLMKIAAVLPASDPTHADVTPEAIDLGPLTRLNNDHVLSFDGKMVAVSDSSQGRQSTVFTVPVTGGTPTRITQNTPSYMHGWSPDAKTLVFAAPRNPATNNGNWDIYSIPSNGGAEVRLTSDAAREDGPEYTPDGQFVYFNSSRSGQMQIWRMRPDGSQQEQVTHDEYNNWFPHISPDGKQMVFISFDKSTAPDDHDGIKDVTLRLMNLDTKAVTTVVKLFGGQGTINVPSWSPNGQYFAFVSYQAIKS